MYMSPGKIRARASGAVGSHGRQDPVPDPRVFSGGRGPFSGRLLFSRVAIFLVTGKICSAPVRVRAREVLPSVRTAARRVSYLALNIGKTIFIFPV